MAHISKRTLATRANGKPVTRWVVKWQEPERDRNGVPIKAPDTLGHNRTRLRRRERTFPTPDAARAFAATLTRDAADGIRRDYSKGDTPLGVYARDWLANIAGEVKPRTHGGYAIDMRRVTDALGGRAVGSITPADARAFRHDLRAAGCGPATIKGAFAMLRRTLDLAIEDGAIATNPAARVKLPTAQKMGRPAFDPYVLSSADVGRIAGHLPAPYDVLVLFAAYTGLRAGELAGLNVGDVALGPAPTVRVTRTRRKVKGGWEVSTPKSANSVRTVPLAPWLAEDMRGYLAAHPYRDNPDAPLWPGRRNTGARRTAESVSFDHPLEPSNFYRNDFKTALSLAGLPATSSRSEPGVRLHDLRHFFATNALTAGVPYQQVSRWLGHATFVITLTVYAHWIPDESAAHIALLARPGAGDNVVPLARRAL